MRAPSILSRASDQQHRDVRSRFRAAAMTGILLVTSCAVFADGFWEKKDWTQWSDLDCSQILRVSPWSQLGPGSGSVQEPGAEAYATFSNYVQFYSALPFRQALARQFELHNNYDKADTLTRQKLDQEINAKFFQPLQDKIVVRYYSEDSEIGKPSFRVPMPAAPPASHPDGVLFLSDGTQVISIQTISLSSTPASSEFRIIFPRFINGQPVIKPGDKKLTIDTGVHEGSKFIANDKSHEITFDLTKMIYKGKLEY
jgi:hypothetical protein